MSWWGVLGAHKRCQLGNSSLTRSVALVQSRTARWCAEAPLMLQFLCKDKRPGMSAITLSCSVQQRRGPQVVDWGGRAGEPIAWNT